MMSIRIHTLWLGLVALTLMMITGGCASTDDGGSVVVPTTEPSGLRSIDIYAYGME